MEELLVELKLLNWQIDSIRRKDRSWLTADEKRKKIIESLHTD